MSRSYNFAMEVIIASNLFKADHKSFEATSAFGITSTRFLAHLHVEKFPKEVKNQIIFICEDIFIIPFERLHE